MFSRPLYKEHFNFQNNILTPYQMFNNSLYETCHIYNYDDRILYKEQIKKALHTCIMNYKNNKFCDLCNHENIFLNYTTSHINYKIIDDLNIDLYITVNNDISGENCINITHPDIASLYHPSEQLYSIVNNELVSASIILEADKNILKTGNIEKYVKIIQHEIIHIMHEHICMQLNANAGYGYTIAELICKHFCLNIDFPLVNNLQDADLNNLSDLYMIIAGCFYYLNTSEYSAWLDTYASEVEYNNTKNTETLNIYNTLYLSLIQKKTELNKALFIILNSPYINHQYFKSYFNNKKIKSKNIIDYWIRRAQTFINKCHIIYSMITC